MLYKSKKMDFTYDEIIEAYKCGIESKRLPSQYYYDSYKLRFHPDKSLGYNDLEQRMTNVLPNFAYYCFARLVSNYSDSCNLVITTNFDDLVEDALFIFTNKKPLIVNHESLAEYANSPHIKRPIVAKVHRGLFFDPLNDKQETEQLKGKWYDVLSNLFLNYTPIIIGYGGGDRDLMSLLQDDSIPFKRRFYWCSYKNDVLDNPTICQLLLDKNGVLVETDGFESVMLKFGNKLFQSEILPNHAISYLENQNNGWIKQYIDSFFNVARGDNSDSRVLNDANISNTTERENNGKLTKWDFNNRGIEKFKNDDFTGAIDDFNCAITIDPTFAIAYSNKGGAYDRIGIRTEALSSINTAIALDPYLADAYCNRGIVYSHMGDDSSAIVEFTVALKINQHDDSYYYNRAISYMNVKRFESAIEDLDKAIEIKDDNPVYFSTRGNAKHFNGLYQLAIDDYSKAISLDPNNAMTYNNRACAYQSLQEDRNAISDFNKAVELDPNNKTLHNNQMGAYFNLWNSRLEQ